MNVPSCRQLPAASLINNGQICYQMSDLTSSHTCWYKRICWDKISCPLVHSYRGFGGYSCFHSQRLSNPRRVTT